MQLDMKGNKLIETLLLEVGIIKQEQNNVNKLLKQQQIKKEKARKSKQ